MESFSAAMKKTFGLPGETAGDFMRQLKALNDEDRAYYSDAMNKAGIPHEPPKPAA